MDYIFRRKWARKSPLNIIRLRKLTVAAAFNVSPGQARDINFHLKSICYID